MRTNKKIELLAPAGDYECLQAAIQAGCDAVYLGLKEFNMRERAKNFALKDLPIVNKLCRKNKVKMYLTLNTIVYDSELKKIEKIIKKAKKYVDAIICWDAGVIELCRKHKVDFHISTQASVSNERAARFYKKLGAKRIILARELNLGQIKKISKIVDTEVFAHGAMCVSISGRCFTSQFLFGNKFSANRGGCMHPCRRSYLVKDNEGNELRLENNRVMSAKDLCTLPFIDRIKKSGVRAIKIEGRNKEPEYVYTVVKVYRKAIDNTLNKREIEEMIVELKKVYNKGLSSGFFIRPPTPEDFSNQEHSSSTEKKEFIGKIGHYFSKKEVAAIELHCKEISEGDEIWVIGKKTGVIRQKIDRMEINHKVIEKARKGMTIAIKIPKARQGDEVYLISKRLFI